MSINDNPRCRCGSYGINPLHYGRDPDTDIDLCDVCYWRRRAEGEEGSIRADLRRAASTWYPDLHLFGVSRVVVNAFGRYLNDEYFYDLHYDAQVWLCLLVAEAL